MIRLVVADDHPMVRYGIAAVVARSTTVELVGEAGDAPELLAVVDRTRPDVVLTDLSMPGMEGGAMIRRLSMEHPDLPVLVLTMHEDDEQVFGALRAGAQGYLIKGVDGAELERSIESVAAGNAVYGQAVANRIIAFFTGTSEEYAAKAFPELTGREREVLDLMALGLRNRAIGDRLGMAEKTVRNHVSVVLQKLQVSDRTSAAIKARDAGLGQG
ncbi:response regulator transcription factor [Nocardioides sp. HM23]|uniref:response regulator transcription factor n=1 Tax=Nocardioides bizhenqiangii TaxID=3095076 RepID=UPI002ACAA115|nr:response regulator transcription factor [Nocardioides sp. HM23]MDZ5622331.1 response regulator transcription factor [Nocardioides sp. HM23]